MKLLDASFLALKYIVEDKSLRVLPWQVTEKKDHDDGHHNQRHLEVLRRDVVWWVRHTPSLFLGRSLSLWAVATFIPCRLVTPSPVCLRH